MRLLIDICVVQLDGGNNLIMNVHSGRNEIQHANLRVEGPTGLKFDVENAKVLTESSSSCKYRAPSSASDTIYRSQVMERVSRRHRAPQGRKE